MSSLAMSLIVFAFVFGGALLGIFLRAVLPEHHLSQDSKDVVKLGMGLIGTMSALVLGLMVGSAKSSYDLQRSELTEMSAKIIMLDRALAHYGPETKEVRGLLRTSVTRIIDRVWPKDAPQSSQLDPSVSGSEVIYDKIQELSPKDDAQRSLKSQALSAVVDLGQTRWLIFEQGSDSFVKPFLIIVAAWFTVIFISFGLFAPKNATVMATLFLSALSVAGAILLILELYTPFQGLIQLSSDPLHSALAHLGM